MLDTVGYLVVHTMLYRRPREVAAEPARPQVEHRRRRRKVSRTRRTTRNCKWYPVWWMEKIHFPFFWVIFSVEEKKKKKCFSPLNTGAIDRVYFPYVSSKDGVFHAVSGIIFCLLTVEYLSGDGETRVPV